MQKPLKHDQRHEHKDEPEQTEELGHNLACHCEEGVLPDEAISWQTGKFFSINSPHLNGDTGTARQCRCCFGQAITALAMTLTLCCFRNRHELFRLEACPTDQRAVDVWKGKEFGRIGSRHRAAIQNADGLSSLRAEELAQRGANDLMMHEVRVLSTRGFSCPDRPDGFI